MNRTLSKKSSASRCCPPPASSLGCVVAPDNPGDPAKATATSEVSHVPPPFSQGHGRRLRGACCPIGAARAERDDQDRNRGDAAVDPQHLYACRLRQGHVQ